MKIGVNARFLTKPFTGIGRYTRYLFEEMAKQNPEAEFVMVVNSPVDIKMPDNVRIFPLPEKFPGTSGMKKTYWEQVQLAAFFLKHDVDLVHFPYPCNFWKEFKKPTVVTVHDAIPWTMAPYRKSLSTRLYQDRCKKAVNKADHVFAVSEAARKEIIEVCGLDPNKTSVSYNALPDYFFRTATNQEKENVLNKHGLSVSRPFILYIGGYDIRKNVNILLEAFLTQIAPKYELDLVMVGGKHLNDRLYQSYDLLTKIKDKGKLQANKGFIKTIGFVPDDDLPALYQSSFAFINLSSKEGFNLPLLEAAVSGTPVITSDLPVHHEVLGEYGIYCRPDDKDLVAEIIKKLFTDNAFYLKQKQKTESFRCPFSWVKTAETVMKTYKMLV